MLLSCPPNRNSPRTWSVSSILGLCNDLLSIRHSSHLRECSMTYVTEGFYEGGIIYNYILKIPNQKLAVLACSYNVLL